MYVSLKYTIDHSNQCKTLVQQKLNKKCLSELTTDLFIGPDISDVFIKKTNNNILIFARINNIKSEKSSILTENIKKIFGNNLITTIDDPFVDKIM